MKIKDTINFKTLRDKGPKSLELQNDEVVQITTKGEVLCVVRQEYLQQLIESSIKSVNHQLSALNTSSNFFNSMPHNEPKLSAKISGHAFGLVGQVHKSLEQRVSDLETEVSELKKNKK